MAIISFNKSAQGTTANIAGSITSSTIKVMNSYIERKKLDVQSTTVKAFGVQLAYQK